MTAAESAADIAEGMGWYMLPIRTHGGQKRPAMKGWQAAATCDPDEVRALFEAHPGCQVGVHVGRSGLVVVDIDRAPIPTMWQEILDRNPTLVFQSRNRKLPHYVYSVPSEEVKYRTTDFLGYGELLAGERFWLLGGAVLANRPVASLPAELAGLIKTSTPLPAGPGGGAGGEWVGHVPRAEMADWLDGCDHGWDRWREKFLSVVLRKFDDGLAAGLARHNAMFPAVQMAVNDIYLGKMPGSALYELEDEVRLAYESGAGGRAVKEWKTRERTFWSIARRHLTRVRAGLVEKVDAELRIRELSDVLAEPVSGDETAEVEAEAVEVDWDGGLSEILQTEGSMVLESPVGVAAPVARGAPAGGSVVLREPETAPQAVKAEARSDGGGSLPDPPMKPEEWWEERGRLWERVYTDAVSVLANPLGEAGALLTRAVAMADRRLVLPGFGHGPSPIGLYTVLVGGSGVGKSASVAKATRIIPRAADPRWEKWYWTWAGATASWYAAEVPAGSGEGMVDAYFDWIMEEVDVKSKGEVTDTKLVQTSKQGRRWFSVLFYSSELAGFKPHLERRDSRARPNLMEMWSGEPVGSTRRRRRGETDNELVEMSYRTSALVTAQIPPLIDVFINDAAREIGWEQRWLYFPSRLPKNYLGLSDEELDVYIERSESLAKMDDWYPPHLPGGVTGPVEVEFPGRAMGTVRGHARLLAGSDDVSDHRSRMVENQHRLAVASALLNGRIDVSDKDYEDGEAFIDASMETRRWAIECNRILGRRRKLGDIHQEQQDADTREALKVNTIEALARDFYVKVIEALDGDDEVSQSKVGDIITVKQRPKWWANGTKGPAMIHGEEEGWWEVYKSTGRGGGWKVRLGPNSP
jgi:hypothetical protein